VKQKRDMNGTKKLPAPPPHAGCRESAGVPYTFNGTRNVSIQIKRTAKPAEAVILWICQSAQPLLDISAGFSTNQGRNTKMLWTIFVILLVLWLVGLVSSYTMGGFIHLLLVLAVIVLVINLLTGRRAV
jgi:hypothetical protein